MTDKKYNGWNDSDTRSSGVPKNEGMTKEQIEQTAEREYPLLNEINLFHNEIAIRERAAFIKGATSPEAKAYHGQGWVSVEEMGNFAEWVRCNYIKVAQGYMYRLASIGSSATKYFQMSDLIKMYLMKPLPSPPNTEK